MNDEERNQILKRLREFANQQRGADELADRGSLDRAAEIVALYEDRTWVQEMPPPKVTRNRGRPVDPESFSRFTKWLADQVPIRGSRAYQLRDAHQLQTSYFHQVERKPAGERELRPLKWLIKHDYAARIPDVWEIACELAGNSSPDEPTVRKALAKWKHDHVPRGTGTSAKGRPGQTLVDRWLRDAHRIMDEYPELFIDAVNRVEAEAESHFGAVIT